MHVYLIRLHEIRGDGDRCVVLGGFRADADAHDVVTRTDDALRPEQPERELEVVARCAHHDAERSAVERDLEGLLGRDLVALLAPGARAPAGDRHRRRLRSRHKDDATGVPRRKRPLDGSIHPVKIGVELRLSGDPGELFADARAFEAAGAEAVLPPRDAERVARLPAAAAITSRAPLVAAGAGAAPAAPAPERPSPGRFVVAFPWGAGV